MIMAESSDGTTSYAVDPQVGYYDGYGIEERLLEGVKFKVECVRLGQGWHLVCNGVHEDDQEYMRKFSKRQMADWCREVVRRVENDGELTNYEGTEDWYYALPPTRPTGPAPVKITKADPLADLGLKKTD